MVVGALLTIEEVGLLVGQRVSMLVAFVLGSVNTILKPKFAKLNVEGKRTKLKVGAQKLHIYVSNGDAIFFGVLFLRRLYNVNIWRGV